MTSYFISGASSGLGAEMARQLTARGDAVALAARRSDLITALATELGAAGGSALAVPLDVTDVDEVGAAMNRADTELGGLDVVVVNAGTGRGARLGTGGFDRNRAMIDTNLTGALAQVEAALELFRPRQAGQIVLVSSLAARRALPGSAAVYSATKLALASIGKSLATEFADGEITVSVLYPGYIRTDLSGASRFPYMTPLDIGVAAMIRAIDAGRTEAVVPAWPWQPLGWLFRVVPVGLIRRFT